MQQFVPLCAVDGQGGYLPQCRQQQIINNPTVQLCRKRACCVGVGGGGGGQSRKITGHKYNQPVFVI